MTGITQLSGKYSDRIAEEVQTPYVEVTAHMGARDKDKPGVPWANHKAWQGKVYSTRSGDKYPNVYAVCGLGDVEGLEGANCRHLHYPFWDGISERTYTDEELANIDPPPFTYQGKRYTAYEATQKQRQIERALRQTKRNLLAYDAVGDKQAYQAAAIRKNRLEELYKDFSYKAGLRDQLSERGNIAEFTPADGKTALNTYKDIAEKANAMYDTGSEDGNINAYMRDLPIRQRIQTEYSKELYPGRQNGHIVGTNEYNMYVAKQRELGKFGPSVVTISEEELKRLFAKYSGTGIILRRRKRAEWDEEELITSNDTVIGYTVDLYTGVKVETTCFRIHYSKRKGWHIVPEYMDQFGLKGEQ